MRLTLHFECDAPADTTTTRHISTKNRTASDLETIIARWKEAYEKQTGESPHVVLADTDPEVSVQPAEIDGIDEVRG